MHRISLAEAVRQTIKSMAEKDKNSVLFPHTVQSRFDTLHPELSKASNKGSVKATVSRELGMHHERVRRDAAIVASFYTKTPHDDVVSLIKALKKRIEDDERLIREELIPLRDKLAKYNFTELNAL